MKSGAGAKKQSIFRRAPTFNEAEILFYAGIMIGFFLTAGSYFLNGLLGHLLYGFGIGVSTTAFLGKHQHNIVKRQIASSSIDISDQLENHPSHQPDLANKVTQEKAHTIKHKAPVPRLAGFRNRKNAASRNTPHEQTSRSWNPLRFLWSNKQVIKPSVEINETCDNDVSFTQPEEKKSQAKHKKNKGSSEAKPIQKHVTKKPNPTAHTTMPSAKAHLAIEQPEASTPPITVTSSSTLDVLKSLESPPSLFTSSNNVALEAENAVLETALVAPLQAELAEEREQRAREQAELAQKQTELTREREQRAREQAELAQKQRKLAEVEQQRDEYAGILTQLTSDSSCDNKLDVNEAKRRAGLVTRMQKVIKQQQQGQEFIDEHSKHPNAYTAKKHLAYLCHELVTPELSEPATEQTTSPSVNTSRSSFR